MFGQIANYAPFISRSSIVKNSTSISGVWQTIRQHYGLQLTGSRFLDLANISLKPKQRPEDLFQSLMAFIEDNLLTTSSGITHHGEIPDTDEELSPSLENFVALTWLRLLHPSLPRVVKQRYGTELRSRTLASVKPDISQALESLLDELHTSHESKVLRSASPTDHRPFVSAQRRLLPKPRAVKSCPLCQQAGCPDFRSHFLSSCKFLPKQKLPDGFGISFAADVIKRYRQLILVVRETSTSFTASCLLDDERRDSIRSGLLRLCLELRPLSGPPSVIRVDPAPGFAVESKTQTRILWQRYASQILVISSSVFALRVVQSLLSP